MRSPAQALQAGGGQHDGVVLAFVELAQAGVEVAAQRLDRRSGRSAAAAPGGAGWRCRPPRPGAARPGWRSGRDKGVARVFALHHAGQGKAFGQLHRHVLERVHGDVGAAFFQRHFQLLDEQALAPPWTARSRIWSPWWSCPAVRRCGRARSRA
jgi:hypothetical protein